MLRSLTTMEQARSWLASSLARAIGSEASSSSSSGASPSSGASSSSSSSSSGAECAAPEPPDNLCCPITLKLFEEPVFAADGQTYERKAIEAWLKKAGNVPTSPLTGEPLKDRTLRPNFLARALRP